MSEQRTLASFTMDAALGELLMHGEFYLTPDGQILTRILKREPLSIGYAEVLTCDWLPPGDLHVVGLTRCHLRAGADGSFAVVRYPEERLRLPGVRLPSCRDAAPASQRE